MPPDDQNDDTSSSDGGPHNPRGNAFWQSPDEVTPASGQLGSEGVNGDSHCTPGGEPEAYEPCGLPVGEPPAEGDKVSVVEAVLFVSPDPLSTGRIAEITGIEPGAVREILNRLVDTYLERGGGLVVREVAGGFGFYAVPAAAPYIARLISSTVNPRLTRAALESLAIVAYLQPVSRGLVAEIRGVQSEGVIKTLEERGLVQPAGKGGPPGYPVLYRTTGRFLERFGLKSIEELPPLEDFSPDEEMIEKIKRSLSWEILDENGARGEKALLEEGEGGRDAAGTGEDTEDTLGSGDSLEEGVRRPDNGGPGHGERKKGDYW